MFQVVTRSVLVPEGSNPPVKLVEISPWPFTKSSRQTDRETTHRSIVVPSNLGLTYTDRYGFASV